MSYESCIASSSSKRETQSQLMAILFSCGQDSSVNPSKVQIWAPQWVPNAPKTIQKSPKKITLFGRPITLFGRAITPFQKLENQKTFFVNSTFPKLKGHLVTQNLLRFTTHPAIRLGDANILIFSNIELQGPTQLPCKCPRLWTQRLGARARHRQPWMGMLEASVLWREPKSTRGA